MLARVMSLRTHLYPIFLNSIKIILITFWLKNSITDINNKNDRMCL
jgi:hypothetical protein